MEIYVAIISKDEKVVTACLEGLKEHEHFSIQNFADVAEFRDWVTGRSVASILIDLKTLLAMPLADREYINGLTDALPVAKLRIDANTNEMTASVGSSALTGTAFFEYISTDANSGTGRPIRRFARKPKLLNLKVYGEPWGTKPLLANTLEASEGGCFILTTTPPPPGTKLQIEMVEMGRLPAVEAEVRWILEWGKSTTRFAGCGIQLLNMSDEQRDKYREILGLA